MTAAVGLHRLRPDTVYRTVLGPAIVVVAYALALAVVLPAGVNRKFVMVLAVVAGVVAAVGLVLLWVSRREGTARTAAATPNASSERVHLADGWLILLPLTPVVQYVWLNRDILSLPDGLLVIGACALVASLFVLVVPFLLARFLSATVMMIVGVGLTFMLFDMAALTRSNAWHAVGDPVVQLGLFALIILAGLALYRRQRPGTYLLVALYFGVTVVGLVAWDQSETEAATTDPVSSVDSDARAGALATLAESDIEYEPDIFLMTYDAYVGNETMLQYGIDNSDQEAWLESQGFEIYPGAYSVASATSATMGRVLGAVDTPGSYEAIAGKGPYLDVLRDWGYSTHGIFKGDYWFRNSPPAYDTYYPQPGQDSLTLLLGISEGEFQQDLEFDAPSRPRFLKRKRSFIRSKQPGPLFLYSHTGPSHSELSGTCPADSVEQYASRLRRANSEMRKDVDAIVKNHPGAVVIINGDHGPYLTRSCQKQISDVDPADITRLDIQDRFGTFLAIRWPEDPGPRPPDITTVQDVLPSVFQFLEPSLDVDPIRLPPRTAEDQERYIPGVSVDDGLIVGGSLDGQPLFERS